MDGREYLDSVTKARDTHGLPVIWLADIRPSIAAPWRVHGLLPRTGLALIYGESASGKTYLAIDLALHIAAGQSWCDRRATQGVVVYVAAESPASLKNRVALWRSERGTGGELFAMIPRPINLLGDIAPLIDLLETIKKEHGEIAAVVFDTVARSMAGHDENSGQDMGRLISSCDCIREAVQTLVVLIHHSGKDSSKGARGHSSLRAAVDTEIEVTSINSRHCATVTKQRDGEAGARFEFTLIPHPIGETAEGEMVTSCLLSDVVECTKIHKPKREKLAASERVALAALHTVLDDPKHRVIAGKAGQFGAKYEAWRGECYARHISDGTPTAQRVAFNRAVTGLQSKGRINVNDGAVWLP